MKVCVCVGILLPHAQVFSDCLMVPRLREAFIFINPGDVQGFLQNTEIGQSAE